MKYSLGWFAALWSALCFYLNTRRKILHVSSSTGRNNYLVYTATYVILCTMWDLFQDSCCLQSIYWWMPRKTADIEWHSAEVMGPYLWRMNWFMLFTENSDPKCSRWTRDSSDQKYFWQKVEHSELSSYQLEAVWSFSSLLIYGIVKTFFPKKCH